MDSLVAAVRAGNTSLLRAALRANPGPGKLAQAVVVAGGLGSQVAIATLFRGGADLNASWRGYRPLHALIQEKPHGKAGKPPAARLKCLQWLLAHGADPEQTGAWPPARAIIVAAFVGEPEYVKLLRPAGDEIDGFTAAALGEPLLVANALRRRPEFARERDAGGLTALQCAAGSRLAPGIAVEIAHLLLDGGADPCARTKSWSHEVDAAYLAAAARNEALFELLLDHGADPTQALEHAVWGGLHGAAEAALARGAHPDRCHSGGRPLLNNLVRWGQLTPAYWLLGHGASPNIPDAEGWTAVHQAASRGNERAMRALLDAGGDLAARDHQGLTPLDVAKLMRRHKLVALLAAQAANGS